MTPGAVVEAGSQWDGRRPVSAHHKLRRARGAEGEDFAGVLAGALRRESSSPSGALGKQEGQTA